MIYPFIFFLSCFPVISYVSRPNPSSVSISLLFLIPFMLCTVQSGSVSNDDFFPSVYSSFWFLHLFFFHILCIRSPHLSLPLSTSRVWNRSCTSLGSNLFHWEKQTTLMISSFEFWILKSGRKCWSAGTARSQPDTHLALMHVLTSWSTTWW